MVASSLLARLQSLIWESRETRKFVPLILACAVLVLLPTDAAPHQQVSGTPACLLPQVTLPLFDATPAAVIASTPVLPADGPENMVLPDAATIERAVGMIVACINTGDPALQYAVFTDRYLAEQLADPSVTYQPAFEQEIATGADTATSNILVDSIDELTPFEDGRVSVVVSLSANDATYEDRLVLVNVEGNWLIDEVELIDPVTPAPGQ